MPTEAEIVAAMQVTNEWSDMSRAERREFAIDVLAAAEEVRAKANECHALDRDYGLCQCPICRAYRAGRGDERFVAAHMPDQRMTQTHAPLASYVEWSLPGDPASYDPIAKVWHPAVMAALSEAACGCWRCMRERNDTVGMSRFVVCRTCGNKRCPHANDHDYYCTGSNEPGQPGSAYPATSVQQPPPSQAAPTPTTPNHGRDYYHTSGVPGDGIETAGHMVGRHGCADID